LNLVLTDPLYLHFQKYHLILLNLKYLKFGLNLMFQRYRLNLQFLMIH